MNKNTNTQTDNETPHMSLPAAHFFPNFFRAGKYLLPLLAGLFILAACGGGGAAPAPTVTPDTTEVICANNLFDTRCDAPDVETKREEKIEECFTGDAAGNADCKNAVEEHSCLEDPFDATCTDETVGADFVVHLQPAKDARAEFCRQGNNINNAALCGNAVTSLCPVNPFDTVCFADATYRDMRIVACSGATPPTDSATVCRRSEITDIVCAATGANAAPFNITVCGADDGVMNAAVRQEFCRANLSDGLCTNTISTFCATIDAGKFTDALCGTPASAAVRGTYCVSLEAGNRPGACGNDTEENSLVRAYCTSGSAEALLDTNNNCAVSLAKACETAPFGHACTTDANIRARAVMCRANTNGSNSCDTTITAICEGGGVAITANIFDDLCDVGYDNLRTMACVRAPSVRALPSPKCGSEITSGPLFIYCRDEDDGATNSTHCPERYKAAGVRAARWQTDAVDATNENPMTPIPAGGADKDDAFSNFIVGGEEGLDFVVDDTITLILRNGARKLNILDDSDDGKSGFGYVRARLADADPNKSDKNYVGLLSGTDVGAPIRDNSLAGTWSANLTVLLGPADAVSVDFILDVSFGPNTIKTRAGFLPSLALIRPSTFVIDGKFTNAGVIYGTTELHVDSRPVSFARLSGLIGVDGAVGVFASDSSQTNLFAAYSGGFVAALGCTDYPFNVGCTSDVDIRARATACLGDIMTNGVGGCDATARTICRDGTTGSGGAIAANILDPLCLSAPAFVDDIITACNNAQNNQGVFADCPAFLAEVCPISGVRRADCPAQVQTGNADFILWKQDATDVTNTNKVTILDKLTGTTDPTYSYVEGRADGLERGEYLLEEDTHEIRADQFDFHQILRLSDLVGSEDTSSGAAFRQFNVRDSSTRQNVSTHTYAGLLSGTNLGAPISDTNPTVLLWAARLQLVALAILFEADFTMEVNFGDKTIRTREDMDAPAVPRAIARTSVTIDSFSIDGTFTDAGVIYGTTELKRTRRGDELSSKGSLTGLIGERGAAGVFFSNDNQKTFAGSYVGGFVAIPTSCEFYPFGAACIEDEYIMERLRMCNEDININGPGGCNATFDIVCRDGNIGTGNGAIVGNPNHSLCVGNVRTGNADTALWKRDAVDTDGTLPLTPTTPLTILTEVGAHDADENYVQAGADELNRGFLVDEDGNFIGNPGRVGAATLNLSDVGLLDDAASGVKHERYVSAPSNQFISRTNRRFYAGILSGTDLGARLTVDNTAEMIWNAKLVMVDEDGFAYSNDFNLNVNFGTKTINTTNPIAVASGSSTTGTLILNGKFTPAGVIYGTSQLKLTSTRHRTSTTDEFTSDGSLTGLIGEKGAVGAFISKDALNSVGLYPDTAGRYSGGFVARNPNVCINDPFSGYCDDEDSLTARADMCLDGMPRIVNTVDLCIDTIVDICSDTDSSGSAINPFHMICMDGTTYDDSRRMSCINNRNSYSGSSCADLTTKICETENKLLDAICTDGKYTERREALCAGDSIDDPLITGCEPIITTLCTAEPFNTMAGVGDAKFNCAESGAYRNIRQTRITLCSDEANNGHSLCMQSRVMDITGPCADDPFDAKCDDYLTQYGGARTTRLSDCRDNPARVDVNCTGAALMVCDAANDNNPLDVICAGRYDSERQALCKSASIDESLMATGCAPVINDLCNDNLFSASAGAGDAKFDCNGSDVYHVARQDACLYSSLEPDVCTATIAQTCDVDKEYFSGLCKDTNDDNFEIYEQARIDTCAAHADEIQDRGAAAEDDVIADCFNFLDVDCSQEPFEEKCYVVNLYASKRLDKCSSDLDALEGAYATPADCNRPELAGDICGTVDTLGTDPFAPICAEPTAVAADFVLLDVQHAFCRDGANINGAACADTVTNFCDVAEGRDLFDELCTTGDRAGDYDNYRVFACQVTDANTAVNSECGTIVSTNCTGVPETDSPACMTEGTLPPASLWAYTARNADNTARLRVLDEVQLNDADTNYVQGDATGLNLGELLEGNGSEKTGVSLENGGLSITDLDNVNDGDAAGGVAFIEVTFDGFTSMNKVKYYAGLLDNIDLGAPLANNTANGIWNASFSAIVKGAVQTDTDTSIVIDFDTRSLTTNDDDLVMLSNDAGSISIAGKFTDAGVIYGTSSWTSTLGDKSSAGSVTGLIGAKGAIGAFVSSGENTGDDTDGEYVGGFVAAPVTECVGLDAFTNSLCDGPVGKAGRITYAETCRTTDCTDFVDGNAGPTISDCTNKTGSDPHQTGCLSDSFDAERIARNAMCIEGVASYDDMVCGAALTSCLGTGIDSNCGQLVGAFCDANAGDNRCTDDAPAIKAIVCRDSVFDSRCNTGYDEERQTACAGEDVTSPVKTGCAEVISTLCLANPLENAAGAGATKFDCAGSVTYTEQRHTACAGENIATLSEGDRCLPVITALCDSNPFDNAKAGLGTTTFNCTAGDTFLPERVAACKDNIDVNGGAGGCDTTISNACTADAFDSLCFDRVNDGNYGDYETARISYCQKRIYRTDNFTNDTPDSRTCADFVSTCPTTPFDDKCKIVDDDTYASDRLGFCKGTITDLTAAYGTPADCNTDEFSGVICAQTGVDANPFAPICSDPTAIAIIDNLDLVAVQQGFCRDGANINNGDCADTIANFCDTASGANLFDDLCNTGDTAVNYIDYRVAACHGADANTDVHSTCASVISTNCTGDVPFSPACVTAGTLPISAWLYGATNKDNTTRLEILEEVGLDDAYTNYIQGDATGLNIDVLYDQGTFKAGAFIRSGILSITDLDNVDDNATGGVATARISSPDFTDNPLGSKHRYYAGLLSNVDLGGPLVDNSADGIWNARFYAIYGMDFGGVQTDLETTMIINFDAKSLKTRDIDDALGLADPVALSNDGGNITINAKFTTAGVIYGTSGWSDGVLDGNSSTGTVTGLIGKYGAIGAFLGSGKNIGGNTQGEYAGGFVAAPVDCTQQTGNPFYRLCLVTNNAVMIARNAVCDADTTRAFDPDCADYIMPEQKTAFAAICRLDANAKGCELPINGISGLTVADCADNDTGNPYNTGCADDIFAAERTARDLTCKGNDVYDASQCSEVLGNCFGSVSDTGCDTVIKLACDTDLDGRCGAQVPTICGTGGIDPLSIICETGYDAVRQTECMGQDIAMLSEGNGCLPVITALCELDPFNNAVAGMGGTTFDCTAGDTYLPERVVACENDINVNGGAGGCDTTISDACPTNPFSTLCDNTYQPARDTACRASPGAYGLQCDHLKTICTSTPLDEICRNDERYAGAREDECGASGSVNVGSGSNCRSTVVYRCAQEPFSSRRGASGGTSRYNCADSTSAIYDVDSLRKAREASIALCKNPDNSGDPLCTPPAIVAFIARCARDPFNVSCRKNGDQYGPEQAELINDCRRDDSLPRCDVHGIRTRLCTTAVDGTPFAPFCDTSDFKVLRGTALRVAYCNLVVDETKVTAPDPRCAPFADEFCSNAVGVDFGRALFSPICTTGEGHEDYDLRRVAACTADITVNPGCKALLAKNCDANNPSPECAIATTAVWENHAVSFDNVDPNNSNYPNALDNPNNISRLDVLDEAGEDDPHVNYVKAGADGLNLDFVKDEDGEFKTGLIPATGNVTREVTGIGEDGMETTITVTDKGAVGERNRHLRIGNNDLTTTVAYEKVLKLYDAGTYEDTASGVAFAHIHYGDFAYDSVHGYQRYYAGILSGTDLGGRVTNTTEIGVDWNGTVGFIYGGLYFTDDFTLTINFRDKTFAGEYQLKNHAPVATETIYLLNLILNLNGKFNNAGVIYGSSRATLHTRSDTGVYRCENTPPAKNLACELLGYTGRGNQVSTTRGSLTGLIGERGAVGVFVSDSDAVKHPLIPGASYAGGFVVDNPAVSPDCSLAGNIFDLVLCPNAAEVRRDACINRGTSGENLPTGVTESDCDTPELVALICRTTPLDTLCTDDIYDAHRQLVCGGQDVNNPAQPLCAPVIEKLCTAEPFNRVAGPGANKFDCTSVNSEPVIQARNTRIALCLATPDDPLCKQGHVPVALASCADNPDGPICRADGIRAALTVCSDNPTDPICKADDVRAALAACADNPSGRICTRGVTGILSACGVDQNAELCREGADEIVAVCVADRAKDNPSIAICSTPGLADLLACKDRIVTASRACQRENASAVLTACANAPNEPLCTQEGVSAIVSACVINPQSPLCLPRGVPSVLTTCAADPLDAACTDVAEHYTQARVDRLEICRGKASTRVGVKCDNALPTICAEGDTPFAQICEGYDETQGVIAQTCATDTDPTNALCDTVVLPVSGGDDVLVKDCIENPYTTGCAKSVFYAARAVICESEATSFTAGCLSDSDFASNYRSVEVAEEKREAFLTRCTDSNTNNDEGCHTIVARTAREALIKTCAVTEGATGCNTIIANSTTLVQCIANPFLADCSGTKTTLAALTACLADESRDDCSAEVVAFATATAVASALMTHRDALVARCGDSNNMDRTGCDGEVAGGITIEGCTMVPFDAVNCSVSAFDAYRGVDCTLAANAFATRCQGGIDGAVITARAELALSCAVTVGGTGCDTMVGSSGLTVDGCNATPFATGCEDVAFTNARRVKCNEGSSDDACDVVEGQGVTNYVQGGASELDLGDSIYKDEDDLATYVKDDPKTKNIDESVAFDIDGNRIIDDSTTVRDESRIYTGTAFDANARVRRDGIVQGGLTLNDVVQATDNEKYGFAYAYIPGGRGADNINGWDRYYAGLLSGTSIASLGDALTQAPVDATWHGKVSIVSGLNGSILTEQADFVLTVDFDNKTLTSGDIALAKLGGFFAINGKFTETTGVIYGATSLSDGLRNGISSIGSVTGLIGQNGAVGAFVSSGEGSLVNTFGEYAGGFVASETAPDPTPATVDCSQTVNVLNPTCANTPYDIGSCVVYDLDTLKAESTPTAPQMRCIPVLERLVAREKACAGETDLNTLTEPLCEPVIARVCGASHNLFKTDAGTGDTKFDCTTITEYAARRQHICSIPAYANGGVSVELNGVVSVTKGITACGAVISGLCDADPFAQTKTRRPANLCGASYNTARETTCAQDIINVVSAGAGVAPDMVSAANAAPTRCFDTIIRACADNPFDTTLCSASNVNFIGLRLSACIESSGVNGDCEMIISANCPTDGTPRNAVCPNIPLNAWAASLDVSPESSIPETEDKESRILLGGADGLDTKTNVTSIHAPEFVLRLSDSKYNRVPHATETQVVKVIDPANPLNLIDKTIPTYTNVLNQDYNSGIAVFSARTTGSSTIRHYVGILSGTDVGLPITDPAVEAEWDGDMAWVSDNGESVKRAYKFTLNVNFVDGSISTPTNPGSTQVDSGIRDSLGRRLGANDILSFNAKWNGEGILTGTTALRINILDKDLEVGFVRLSPANGQGTLTGLIGNRGAVGVFTSNDDATVAYAGGFVAKPATTPAVVDPIPPTEATWVASFDSTTHNMHERANRFGEILLAEGRFERDGTSRYGTSFATGEADGDGLGLNGDYVASNLGSKPELFLRLDDTSGVAFFFGVINRTNNERFVAGLLSGSTVGDSLPYRTSHNGEASAIWGGVIGGLFPGRADDEFGKFPHKNYPVGISYEGNDFIKDRNFQLEINFEASTIKTPEGKGAFANLNFRFAGEFDRNGIMNGIIEVDTPDPVRQRANGVFSGIIGQDAALGVFRSTGNTNYNYAGGFFATPCAYDIFNPTCLEDDAAAVIAYCNDTDANLGTNPFNVGCNNEADIETRRTTACINNANVDETCPGFLVAFCEDTQSNTGSNPWTGDTCAMLSLTDHWSGPLFNTARDNACLNFGTDAHIDCSSRSNVLTECTRANPYAYVGCNTVITSHINDADRRAYCLTDAGSREPACPNATSGDWVASLPNLNTNPATATDSTPTNEFLQIADKTISTTGTTVMMDGTGGEPSPTTLDFSQITLATPSMALNTDDGLAYFNGYQGSTLYYYAGIFGSTDLGVPIDANITATWAAMLSINGTEAIFDLDVVFDGADGRDNTVKGFVANPIDANPNDLLIAGTFDANGVIVGDVHFANFVNDTQIVIDTPNGDLSGLISTDGAIAVFTSTATGAAGYSGGFVAVPDTARFADWTRSFDGGFNAAEALLDADAIQFVASTANFTKLNRSRPPVLNDQTLVRTTFLRLNSIEDEMGYESGLVFWHGTAGEDNAKTLQYYAGLLPTTDLGAPLTDVSKNGTWTGKIEGVTNGDALMNTEVRFKVIFGDTFANGVGTIKSIANEQATYTYVNETLGAVNVNAPNTGGDAFNNTFDFTGGFNAQGVITGTVAHTNGKPTVGGTVNGVFNGLIGINGAVGLFKSNDSQAFGFIGGFVANPPAE